MGFSSVVAVCFILFACLSQMRASVVPTSDPGLRKKTQNFKLRITEKGTSFDEQIEIDEDNDIEYFSVPAHNDVLAADFLFDFKMNITLTRLKEQGVCYLTPLPSELPKSSLLKKGLSEMPALPERANQPIKTVAHKWKMDGEIEKTTLRREVRDFCDQFPVYHLYEYTPESAAERLPERAKRQLDIDEFDLCGKVTPSCSPADWILRCKFTYSLCVYYLTCRVNIQRKTNECDNAIHESGRLMCCAAMCP